MNSLINIFGISIALLLFGISGCIEQNIETDNGDDEQQDQGPSNYLDSFFNFVIWEYNNTIQVNVFPFSSILIHSVQWEDLKLIINDIVYPHNKEGDIHIEDDIDITDLVGSEPFVVYFRHIPTDRYYGEFSPYAKRIVSPRTGDEVSGTVNVVVYTLLCNCTGLTKLYIDGELLNNGSLVDISPEIGTATIQGFSHVFDTEQFVNGNHELTVYGKHDELIDSISIEINN